MSEDDGFTSKHTFQPSDVAGRLLAIRWFANCGRPFAADLTMAVRCVTSWREAADCCSDPQWETATLEAQNQLTLWLFRHASREYQQWNDIVIAHKQQTLARLEPTWALCQQEHQFDDVVLQCVRWDALGALMENSYLSFSHSVFFFLELLWVYESGHLPCGWDGEWPNGTLVIY